MADVDINALRGAVERLATGPTDAAARMRALESFAASGFPTRATEAWRYTPSGPLAEATQSWLEASGSGHVSSASWTPQASTLRFVNGNLAVEPEALRLPAGVTLLRDDAPGFESDEPLRALNAAIGGPLYELRIEDDAAIADVIRIEHVASAATAAAFAATRLRITLGTGAAATLVETCQNVAQSDGFLTPRLLIDVGSGASLSHFRRQSLAATSSLVECIDVTTARRADYRLFTLDSGSALARTDVRAELAGPESNVVIGGIALARGQMVDHHVITRHRAGAATSEQHLAAIVGDAGQVSFRGKVVVDPGADGTDSTQSSRNLLLADDGTVNTRPELEIYADDVKCAHGATTGQLDADALFYLTSRGLSVRDARELLIRAFVQRSLNRIGHDELRLEFENELTTALDSLLTERKS